jgi:hypothetical protein
MTKSAVTDGPPEVSTTYLNPAKWRWKGGLLKDIFHTSASGLFSDRINDM